MTGLKAWMWRGRGLRKFGLVLVPMMAVWLSPALHAEPAVKEKGKPAADAQLDTEPAQWMRYVDDGKGGATLEVATGTYANDKGVTVKLLGAVHVGEKKYYESLQKDFAKCDALLYEMVKPANMGAPRQGVHSNSMISMFQNFLKDVLELDFQLDDIDYTKQNFVHADLDAETFAKMQEERGESLFGLMLGQMMKQLTEGKPSKGGDMGLLDLIEAFNSPDRGRQFKLLLGKNFGELEGQINAMDGTVLVTERNKKALSVLKDEIGNGKKDIGIFYGAAHMHDMESRLALMGFKRKSLEWRVAWDMRKDDKDAKGAKEEKNAN